MARRHTVIVVEDIQTHATHLINLIKGRVRPQATDGRRIPVKVRPFESKQHLLAELGQNVNLADQTFCIVLDIGLESNLAGMDILERLGKGIPIVVVTHHRERTGLVPNGWEPLFVVDKPLPFEPETTKYHWFDEMIVQATEAAFLVSRLVRENKRLKSTTEQTVAPAPRSLIGRAISTIIEVAEWVHTLSMWVKLFFVVAALLITVLISVIIRIASRAH